MPTAPKVTGEDVESARADLDNLRKQIADVAAEHAQVLAEKDVAVQATVVQGEKERLTAELAEAKAALQRTKKARGSDDTSVYSSGLSKDDTEKKASEKKTDSEGDK